MVHRCEYPDQCSLATELRICSTGQHCPREHGGQSWWDKQWPQRGQWQSWYQWRGSTEHWGSYLTRGHHDDHPSPPALDSCCWRSSWNDCFALMENEGSHEYCPWRDSAFVNPCHRKEERNSWLFRTGCTTKMMFFIFFLAICREEESLNYSMRSSTVHMTWLKNKLSRWNFQLIWNFPNKTHQYLMNEVQTS